MSDAAPDNVLAFIRHSADGLHHLACVVNFSPVAREQWPLPLPFGGGWREVLNTDAECYGGTNVGNLGELMAEPEPLFGRDHSARITLPPLGAVWLAPSVDVAASASR